MDNTFDPTKYLDQSVAAYYILHHMKQSIADPSTVFLHLEAIKYIGSVTKETVFDYDNYRCRCELLDTTPAIHHIEAASGF